MGHTRKPCPACGQVQCTRRKDDICNQCQNDLKELADLRAAAAQEELHMRHRVRVNICATPHYMHEVRAGRGPEADQASRDFSKTFIALAQACGSKAGTDISGHMDAWLVKPRETIWDKNEYHLTQDCAVHLRKLYELVHTLVQLAIEDGEDTMRQYFNNLVRGDISLETFSEVMKLDPNEITAKILFASKPQPREPVHAGVLLCKAGQVDGLGRALTAEAVVEIAEAYKRMGVPVELNTAGELWSKPS